MTDEHYKKELTSLIKDEIKYSNDILIKAIDLNDIMNLYHLGEHPEMGDDIKICLLELLASKEIKLSSEGNLYLPKC